MIEPIELHALADGELSPEQEAQLRRRLEGSPEAQAELRSILALKACLQGNLTNPECRAEWRGCVGRLNEIDRSRRVERFVGRYAWVATGALFLVILMGGINRRETGRSRVQTADLARMMTTLVPSPVPSGANTAARDRWLDDILGQARESVDPNRMRIQGFASGELDGRPVTNFALRDVSGDLALFVMPGVLDLEGGELRRDRAFRLGHLQGMNCVVWTDGSHTLALVADRSYEDLATAAARLCDKAP